MPPPRRLPLRLSIRKLRRESGSWWSAADPRRGSWWATTEAREGVASAALEADARQAALEESIASKEAAYLESTPAGNIITGFENYMKGQGGAAAQRRKAGTAEQNRVFSRSSISYRPSNGVRASDRQLAAARARDGAGPDG